MNNLDIRLKWLGEATLKSTVIVILLLYYNTEPIQTSHYIQEVCLSLCPSSLIDGLLGVKP